MRIGPYQLANKLVLAPMAGITDLPFRQLCRRFGAGLAVSEMVSSNSLLWGSEKTRRRADHRGEPEPRSVQILGADPRLMAEAARYNVDNGAQIIDINMGCPAKKVCRQLAGSALLKDPLLVRAILEAVVGAVTVPVTLKMRTGWDTEHKNGVEIARIAQTSGVAAIAVHGRTRACRYRGDAEYDTIARIKKAVSIPVIANGDITTSEKSLEVLRISSADALMIGRAAQGRPWFFRELNHFLKTGKKIAPLEIREVRDIILEHLRDLYRFYGEATGVRVARKHLSWYCSELRDSESFRSQVVRVDSASEQIRLTRSYFDRQRGDGSLTAFEAPSEDSVTMTAL